MASGRQYWLVLAGSFVSFSNMLPGGAGDLASPTRFERATPSLGGKCSIQLSYGDPRARILQPFNGFWTRGEAKGLESRAVHSGACALCRSDHALPQAE